MLRLLFEKTGRAVWISHLDLMRLFQRAFKRAGLRLTHTQGFNPRPSVSIALPLSVGVHSHCELLDFTLDGDPVACEEILRRLNQVLIDGVRVLQVYEDGGKLRDLAFLQFRLDLAYETDLCPDALQKMDKLFHRQALTVPKKTKNGIKEQDIIPMIRSLQIEQISTRTVKIEGVVCCQNPSLNPMQLTAAIENHLPEMKPAYVNCCRIELFDGQGNIFR